MNNLGSILNYQTVQVTSSGYNTSRMSFTFKPLTSLFPINRQKTANWSIFIRLINGNNKNIALSTAGWTYSTF
jgi:hypothetical protein